MKKSIALGILCCFIIIGCGPNIPDQLDLTPDHLSQVKSIALKIDTSKFKIKYAIESGTSDLTSFLTIITLGALLPLLVEDTVDRSIDRTSSNKMAESKIGEYVKELLSESLIAEVNQSNIFEIHKIETSNHKLLSKQGNDALLRIDFEEMSLRRATSTSAKLRLHMRAWVIMTELKKNKTILKRLETVSSMEQYTLDEYKENEARILREVILDTLENLSLRISSYILYSRNN